MSLGNILPPWHQFLDQKIHGAHFSLGIVAGERFAIELTPSTFPQRHFAGDMFPQRHVAGRRVGMLLGKASNIVVDVMEARVAITKEARAKEERAKDAAMGTRAKEERAKDAAMGSQWEKIPKVVKDISKKAAEIGLEKILEKIFVMSQQNLADHLTKRLARDLVTKSAEGMGLKSNQVAEC
ncbi:hypothetical protein Tco_0739402 [Tanacetum coccineum]